MKLEHVALNIPDPAAAARWYAENLDMRIVRGSEQPPYIHFVADSSGHSLLEFYHNPVAPIPDYGAGHPITLHLAFAVEEIEPVRDRLLAVGAVLAGEIADTEAGDRLLFLRDPWGVALQLVQRGQPLG